jgi:hypothetical protein
LLLCSGASQSPWFKQTAAALRIQLSQVLTELHLFLLFTWGHETVAEDSAQDNSWTWQ